MIRHHIAQTAAALLIASAYINPAHAQVPVGDGAHIGMQIQQWSENLVQWGNDANRWIGDFESQVRGQLTALTNPYDTKAKQFDADLQKIVDQLKESNKCDSIKFDASKQLCTQIKDLEVKKAQIYVDALKAAKKDLEEVNEKIATHNQTATQGSGAAAAASITGASSNESGKAQTQEQDVVISQTKLAQNLKDAEANIEAVDKQIALLKGVRVEIARAQIEGKQPGLFGKLLSAGSVALALTADEKRYKADIEAIKATSATGNKY